MNVLKLVSGSGLMIAAQALVWFQMYGPLKIEWLKGNNWFIYAMAIPITFLFVKGVEITTASFSGEMYPTKFIASAIGVVTFAILTWYFNKEGISVKAGVSILLSISIILIQIFWK